MICQRSIGSKSKASRPWLSRAPTSAAASRSSATQPLAGQDSRQDVTVHGVHDTDLVDFVDFEDFVRKAWDYFRICFESYFEMNLTRADGCQILHDTARFRESV